MEVDRIKNTLKFQQPGCEFLMPFLVNNKDVVRVCVMMVQPATTVEYVCE
jgi:hypothetical protein